MARKTLILMLLVEGASLAAFVYPIISLPLLILIGLATLVLSLKNLEWGVYVLFGELFFGSRGHLLEYNVGFAAISLRLVIFSAVFFAWALSVILTLSPTKGKDLKQRFFGVPQNDKFLWLYILLLVVIAFGIVNGYLHHHSLGNIFNDANAYLYLLALPAVFSAIKTKDQVNNIFQILGVAIIVIALKTLVLFSWFAFSWPGVSTMYHWVINQDIGEITGVVGSASRIFMQSQFYSLVGFFIFAIDSSLQPSPLAGEGTPVIRRGDGAFKWFVIFCAILAVIMSLSRSFWLGGIAGAVFAGFMLLFYFKVKIREIIKLAAILLAIAVLEVGGLYAVIKISGGGFADAVSSRSANPADEAAGGARLLLLPELLTGIKQAPVIGKGFGEVVSYDSFLPDRIRPDNPNGTLTSYAFEWGYLDILLKIGTMGFLVYLFFIANIFGNGWRNFQFSIFNFQILGILSGLVALVVLNNTTPYLNHPLGIGYLILAAISFQVHDNG